MTQKSILILANDSKAILDFRWSLIQTCQNQDYQITIVCNADNYYTTLKKKAEENNIRVIPLDFINGGISPFNDLKLIFKIRKLYKSIKPTHVLLYRIKPVLYGALAAYGLPLRVISTITGLGYVYTDTSIKARILRSITNTLYKIALHRNHWVFFQNKDDHKTFLDLNLTTSAQSSTVGGSGIDLSDFPETPLPKNLSFIMVARLLKDKGVWEYLTAAANLKRIYPTVEFKLIGGTSQNPSAIRVEEVQNFCTQHQLTYLGHQPNVLKFLQESSVFVLPSYREGMPRSGLEALSVGRPIITTDTQGCRDLVKKNGLLVSIKDSLALEKAMLKFIENPHQLTPLAKASRKLAENVFDVEYVNQSMLTKILN